MELIIYDKPCLILEAAELVYAFVNNLPAKSLTREGAYCIPANQVAEIQKEITKDLDSQDEELQFYFKGVPVEGREERLSCLACTLLYFQNPAACHEVDEALEYLHSMWNRIQKPFSVTSFNAFTICYAETTRYTNLSLEISRLPVAPQYQNHLIEAFSGFDWHLERLGNILRPLAEKLKPLLQPWVENAAALREQWKNYWLTARENNFWLLRANLINENVQQVRFSLRYFSPQNAPGEFWENLGTVTTHVGVFITPDGKHLNDTPVLSPNDYSTLRLLSNPDRITMLNAMLHEPMSGPALMQKYGFHSGSVFRDLNSLYNAGLLSICVQDGKNTYRTNFPVIQKLATRMLQAIDPDYKP